MVHRVKGLAVGLILTGLAIALLLTWGSVPVSGQNNSFKEARKLWLQADALRMKKEWEKAAATYEEAAKRFGGAHRFARQSNVMAAFCKAMPELHGAKLKPGVYEAAEQGYVNDVKVAIKVSRGRIRGVAVAEHKESRPLKSLDSIPRLILRKQTPSVDATSGATITSYAVMNATRKAIEAARTDTDDDKKDAEDDDKDEKKTEDAGN